MKSVVVKIFNDLDKFRDYCRFNGKVFNEAHLYKNSSDSWRAYQAYLKYKDKPWKPREQRPNNRGQRFRK